MPLIRFEREGSQVILHVEDSMCRSTHDLVSSDVFESIVNLFLDHLKEKASPLLDSLGIDPDSEDERFRIVSLLRSLTATRLEVAAPWLGFPDSFLQRQHDLIEFIEELYDFWRRFDRFVVFHSEVGPKDHSRRPYRTFNATVEQLSHIVRAAYRDVEENITGDHPRIYRQVHAGCDVGLIAAPKPWEPPAQYSSMLAGIPFIRQVLIYPPMIIDPPINKRTGEFEKVDRNPLEGMEIEREKWLCYPAKVGPLTVFVYFHEAFMGLGCSLANLFEVAGDEDIAAGPDAVYLYGAPPEAMAEFGELPTVFYEDEANNLLIAAVPNEPRFGYFGYLKKMILTLHNIAAMKRGVMPFHGAMARVLLRDGGVSTMVLMGDTATGKSETLEALRILSAGRIRELKIIADDMGSLQVDDGGVRGYGTEIGAFIRLDDLQEGYAFGQIDRAIIMSPQKVNARVVLPVTTLSEVLHGYHVDFLLYANNYEQVDAHHQIIQQFRSVDEAMAVFREGAAMSKGTTTLTGLTHSYFANIFGPPQYEDVHEELAKRTFEAAFQAGVFVGQMRTRLGISGMESTGPQEAATALLELFAGRSKK